MNVIEVNDVSKMFRLGANVGNLRDLTSSLWKRDRTADGRSREFWALRDISFSVAEGESFGIIGHNGSGKSTMLKLITGIYQPTKGTFKTQGRIAALIEVGAGFHPDLTGRENVYLYGSVMGMKKREVDAQFDEIVAFSEMEQFIDTPVKRYSSGMYMRLGFAVAAHVNPDIVLVDEVLAVGDEAFQLKCMNKMLELRHSGKTLIFISHNMYAMTELCQRVMLLSHGKIVGIGEPEELISTYRTMTALEQTQKAHAAGTSVPDLQAKDVKITDVWLQDADGRPCINVSSGDTVTVSVSYRVEQPVENPVFGLSVFREDGLLVYGLNTHHDCVPVGPLEPGEGRYSVTFRTFGLLAGNYRFSVDISRTHAGTPEVFPIIDAKDKAVTLNVTSNTHHIGLVTLPHSWDFAGPQAAAGVWPGQEVGIAAPSLR